MKGKVFPLSLCPLSLCLLLCHLSPASCLYDGRTGRRLDFNTRTFLPSSSDLTNFPLSGFFPTDNNQVDTLFSVPGLEDLPPIPDRQPPPTVSITPKQIPKVPTFSKAPKASPSKPQYPKSPSIPRTSPKISRPTFTSNTFPNIQTSGNSEPTNIFSRGFPPLFDPFTNFFNFNSFPRARQNPVSQAVPTSSPFFTNPSTVVTTPLTTPRTTVKITTTTTTTGTTTISITTPSTTATSTNQEESRSPNSDSVHVYDTSDDSDMYDDYTSDDTDDGVAADYPDYSHVRDYPDYYDENHTNTVTDDYPQDDSDPSQSCPGSLRECLTACSPVISINQVAYKLCVNECLDRCS